MQYPSIPKIDETARKTAVSRQNQLTKPAGSLGRLEEIAIQIAGITGNPRPKFQQKGVIVMAADHGVTTEGVSAYPAEVTPQMVLNFLYGGAAVNVLAKQADASVTIVDIGVNAEMPKHPFLIQRKVAMGTQNMAQGPAMSRAQAEQALQVGLDVVQAKIDEGLDLVAIGEMGIGNTTAATAITAVFTQQPIAKITGRGTGIDDQRLAHKIQIVERAIAVNQPNTEDPLDVLAKVGGLEIAGLVGVVIGAAAQHVPVVMDGFIASSAALVAAKLVPEIRPYLVAGHSSVEPGHQAILKELNLVPLLNLDLRLGEGTGAVLAFHLIEAAVRSLDEMATFAEAAVSGKRI